MGKHIAKEAQMIPLLMELGGKDAVIVLEDAIKIANASEYGLQRPVFTSYIFRTFEIAGKLEVGTVQINNKTERSPDHLPFLGVKSSGIGVQGISYSIEAITRIKSTVINL